MTGHFQFEEISINKHWKNGKEYISLVSFFSFFVFFVVVVVVVVVDVGIHFFLSF